MDWWIWTPVLEGFGTLSEVQEKWDIDDILDAHEIVSMKQELSKEDKKRDGN